MANCLWHKATASDAGWKLPWMRRRLLAYVYKIVYKQKLVSTGCMGMASGDPWAGSPTRPAHPAQPGPHALCAQGLHRMPHPQARAGIVLIGDITSV